jgi:hypothetical protein
MRDTTLLPHPPRTKGTKPLSEMGGHDCTNCELCKWLKEYKPNPFRVRTQHAYFEQERPEPESEWTDAEGLQWIQDNPSPLYASLMAC